MIALDNVFLTLGNRRILEEITFQVAPGETKVILGGSGSGKTTILRLILGLHKPESGSIQVAGEDISGLHDRELPRIRRQMAMVFQGAALFDSLTVRENVGYRLWEHGIASDDQIEQTVRESLQFVGLEDTIDKMPADLSGGMHKGVTQVIVTHELDLAFRVADRIVMIQKGRIAFQGTPQELSGRDDPAIRGFLDPASLSPEQWDALVKRGKG